MYRAFSRFIVSVFGILKNPMILMSLVSLGLFVGMPKLMENSKSPLPLFRFCISCVRGPSEALLFCSPPPPPHSTRPSLPHLITYLPTYPSTLPAPQLLAKQRWKTNMRILPPD